MTTACLVGAAWAAGHGAAVGAVVMTIACAFVPYALLAVAPLPTRVAQPVALALASVAGLAMVGAPPLLSDDLYRYLWDARVLSHGLDPYAFAPDDPALLDLRDGLFARINHADLPTIYPPLAQLVFGVENALAHAVWSPKLVALCAHLATVPVVARLAGDRAHIASPLHALNPLALEEAALNGHVDAFVALFLALSALALLRGRVHLAALALGAVSGLKLVGLALVPLVGRRKAAVLLALGLGLASLATIAHAGHGRAEASGLGHYARRWRGNEGGFALLAGGSTLALDGVGRLTGAPAGWIRLTPFGPLLSALRGTPFDPRAALLEPKKEAQRPLSFQTSHLGDLAGRVLAVGIVALVALRHARRNSPPLPACRDVVLALLLFAPQVHPWYVVWLLPLDIAAGGLVGWVWSAAALVAYAPLDGWNATRVWHEWPVARVVEYALVFGALGVERWSRARAAGASDRGGSITGRGVLYVPAR